MTKPILVVLASLMSLGVAFGQSQMSNPYVRPACTATITTNCTPQVDGGGAYVPVVGAGLGDVVGPAKATDGHMAVFDTTTGKLLKDGGAIPVTLPPSGAAGGALAGTYPDPTLAYVATNPQTGTTYAILTGDRQKLITHVNGAATADSIAQAGSAGFPNGWETTVLNSGAGAVTITPATSTIEGAATLVLTTGQGARIWSDGTNYRATRLGKAAAATLADTVTSIASHASTELTDTTGLVRGAAALTTDNKVVAVSATDGTLQEIPNQTANYIYSGPVTGAPAAPAFRGLVSADIPNNAANTSGNANTATALAANPTDCSTGGRATTIAANGNLTCVANPIVDVKGDYGAVGDGSTNDYTAIAAAITAAGTGGTVVFPPGTYKVDTGLVVSANNVTLRCGGAIILRGANVTILQITGDGVTVDGCKFDGDNPTRTGTVLQAGPGADGTVFRDVEVFDASEYGIYVFDAPNTLIDNAYVHGGLNIHIFAEFDSSGLRIINSRVNNTGCTAVNCHAIGIHSTNPGDVVDDALVSNNELVNNSNHGFCVEWGDFYGGAPSRASINNNICRLTGTTVAGCYSVGGGIGVTVNGNLCDAGAVAVDASTIGGIEIGSSTDCTATGNVIRMPSAVGGSGIILNNSKGCTLSGNSVNGFGIQASNAGIYAVAGASDILARNLLIGNSVTMKPGTLQSGILLQALHNTATLSGNSLLSNFVTGSATASQTCITLDNWNNATFADNAVSGNQLDNCDYGLIYSRAQTGRIIGNSVPRYMTVALGFFNTPVTPLIDSMEPMLFTDLPAALNGSRIYCSDCTIASPCAGGSTGALAKRLNGAWICN